MADPRRIEIVRRLFVLFPRDATVERIEAYAATLQNIALVDLAVACDRLARVWKGPRVPPAAAVRERAEDAYRERSQRRDLLPAEATRAPTAEDLAAVAAIRDLRRRLHRIPGRAEIVGELEARGLDRVAGEWKAREAK